MSSNTALKIKNPTAAEKRLSLKQKFGQPQYVLEQMAEYMKDGDVASVTDLIASYISNSAKYKSQDQFADAIGTTRQTLHRMLSHNDNVSIKIFFNAIEQIHQDSQ